MRKRKSTESLNLAPLVDMMTNVVCVLVILLLATQLSNTAAESSTSGKSRDDVSMDELEAVKREVDRIETLLNSLKERWNHFEKESGEKKLTLAQMQKDIEKLNQERDDLGKASLDEDALKRLITQREKEAAEMETNIKMQEEEFGKLKAKQIELQSEPPAIPLIARLPSPRPAPEGSVPVIFFCRYGRIAYYDIENLSERVRVAIEQAITTVTERIPSQAIPAVIDYFDNNIVGTEEFRLRFEIQTRGKDRVLVQKVEWRRKDAGENLEQIQSPDSAFQRKVRSLDSQRQWITFSVWGDCFDVYPAAREIAAKRGFSAGWDAYDVSEELIIPLLPDSKSGQVRGNVLD